MQFTGFQWYFLQAWHWEDLHTFISWTREWMARSCLWGAQNDKPSKRELYSIMSSHRWLQSRRVAAPGVSLLIKFNPTFQYDSFRASPLWKTRETLPFKPLHLNRNSFFYCPSRNGLRVQPYFLQVFQVHDPWKVSNYSININKLYPHSEEAL